MIHETEKETKYLLLSKLTVVDRTANSFNSADCQIKKGLKTGQNQHWDKDKTGGKAE